MFGFIWVLIGATLFLLLPLWALLEIVKGFSHKVAGESVLSKKLSGESEYMVALFTLLIAVTGLASLYSLPEHGFVIESEALIFAIRVALSVGVVLIGYKLGALIGKTLMLVGVITLVFSMAYVFENFGDTGAFITVLLAFAALVYVAIRVSKKESKNE